jgi:ACS family hexuronate transporter-like MFS transporter
LLEEGGIKLTAVATDPFGVSGWAMLRRIANGDLTWGWPSAFAIVGCAGFVWLAFWWPTYRTPALAAGEAVVAAVPVRELVGTRFVIAFTVAKIFFDPVWYFYLLWFPEYLKNARHFDLAAIGKYSWIPFAVAGAGNFAGGWLTAFLLRRGMSATTARKGAATFFTCLMTAAIPAVLAPEAWQSIALVSVAMMGYTGGLANMLAMPADVFPKGAVASVFGLASMGSGFGGMVFTLITGWVVDHYSYTPVFIGFGIVPLISAGILWVFLGPLRRAEG